MRVSIKKELLVGLVKLALNGHFPDIPLGEMVALINAIEKDAKDIQEDGLAKKTLEENNDELNTLG